VEVKVIPQDWQQVLVEKESAITRLQIGNTALTRMVEERDAEITALQAALDQTKLSSNGKPEELIADTREKAGRF
jgi:predicted RNase H-like nuclease (RuvC/YqgF family)